MSAVREPPDYRKLYDEQCLKNKMLQCKNDQLKETLRDQMAMDILPALLWVDGIYNPQAARDAYVEADKAMEARKQ